MPVGPPEDINLWRFLTSVSFLTQIGGAGLDKNYLLKKALYLTKKGYYKAALKCFEEEKCYMLRPFAMSYYALCLARVKKDYENAISLCITALKRAFYSPEIYVNLGRILILSDRKAHALKAFRKGLMLDDTHPGLIRERHAMGLRRRPLIPYLSRENPVNKFFGVLTRRFDRKVKSEDKTV
jgi:tetratricopeptide (TPR) repeat protein